MLTLLPILIAKLMVFKPVIGVYNSLRINTPSLWENGFFLQEGTALMVLYE